MRVFQNALMLSAIKLTPLHRPINIIHIDMLADEGGEFVVLLLLEGFVVEGGGGGGGVEAFG